MKVCVIHQPTFFPWLGFFDKLRKCDIFVFLNDAQMPGKSGSYMNRVQIISEGEPFWITAPIKRPPQIIQKINEVEIVGNKFNRWREKFKRTLQVNYAKCKYFEEYKDFIFDLIDSPSLSLENYNINAIWRIAWLFGIDDFLEKIRFSSFMNIETTGTERLIDITKKMCCDTYLSGAGGADYMDERLFAENGINLMWQNFEHPVYDQANTEEFIKGLSIVDCLLNIGVKNA